jgi:hypothetical protein
MYAILKIKIKYIHIPREMEIKSNTIVTFEILAVT